MWGCKLDLKGSNTHTFTSGFNSTVLHELNKRNTLKIQIFTFQTVTVAFTLQYEIERTFLIMVCIPYL